MKKYPWLVLDYEKQPPEMVCRHCEVVEVFRLPMPMDGFTKQIAAFTKIHKLCKEVTN